MIGGGEAVRQDVPPFALCARGVVALNSEGMRRAGFDKQAISQMKAAYKILYGEDVPLAEAQKQIAAMAKENAGDSTGIPLQKLADFLLLDNLELIRPTR